MATVILSFPQHSKISVILSLQCSFFRPSNAQVRIIRCKMDGPHRGMDSGPQDRPDTTRGVKVPRIRREASKGGASALSIWAPWCIRASAASRKALRGQTCQAKTILRLLPTDYRSACVAKLRKVKLHITSISADASGLNRLI